MQSTDLVKDFFNPMYVLENMSFKFFQKLKIKKLNHN